MKPVRLPHRLSLPRKLGRKHLVAAGAVSLALLVAAAWMVRVPPGETPLLRVAGPSFIFNYRVADIYYGFTAELMRPVPVSSTLTAAFEDPSGGPPLVVSEKIFPQSRRYSLRSRPCGALGRTCPTTSPSAS